MFRGDEYIYLVDEAGNPQDFFGMKGNINQGLHVPYKVCTVHTEASWEQYKKDHPWIDGGQQPEPDPEPNPDPNPDPIPDPDPRGYDGYYETRCLFKAELENGVTVLVTHFGLNPDEHQNAVDTILPHLKSEKCILMGDFNVTPDNPVLAPIYACMKDTAEAFAEPKLSWPSDVPTKKIDYIFVSPDAKVISADIAADMTSDRRPYITEIVFE
jgi:hypothetical protein